MTEKVKIRSVLFVFIGKGLNSAQPTASGSTLSSIWSSSSDESFSGGGGFGNLKGKHESKFFEIRSYSFAGGGVSGGADSSVLVSLLAGMLVFDGSGSVSAG